MDGFHRYDKITGETQQVAKRGQKLNGILIVHFVPGSIQQSNPLSRWSCGKPEYFTLIKKKIY